MTKWIGLTWALMACAPVVAAELTFSSAAINLDGSRLYLNPQVKRAGKTFPLLNSDPRPFCWAMGAEGVMEFGTRSAIYFPYKAVTLNASGEPSEPSDAYQVLAWVRCSPIQETF